MARPPPDPLYSLRGSTGEVTSVAFLNPTDEQCQLLASGSSDGQATTWNLTTRRPVCTFAAHQKSVLAVEFADRNRLFSQGRDGFIRLWSLVDDRNEHRQSPCILAEIKVEAVGFCRFCSLELNKSLATSGPETMLMFPGENETVLKTVTIATKTGQTGQPVYKLGVENPSRVGMCMAVRLFEIEKQLFGAGGFECGDILVWKLEGEMLMTRVSLHKEPLTCFSLDLTSMRGISGAAENMCYIFEFEVNGSELISNCLRSIELPGVSKGVCDTAVRSDGRICAVGCWEGTVQVFSWKKLKPLAVLTYHTLGVSSLTFSQSCSSEPAMLLAAGSRDKRISIWSLYN